MICLQNNQRVLEMLVFYDAKNINLRKEKKESFACATFAVDYVQETVSLEMFLQTEVSSESAKKAAEKRHNCLEKDATAHGATQLL